LFFAPAVVPLIVAETMHCEFGARDAPDRMIEEEPSAAATVPPLQSVVTLPGVATTRPDGRVSVKASPLRLRFWLPLLSIVKVREVVPLSGMLAAPNALATRGGLMTVRPADVVLPLPASDESIWTLLL
jgi:hypothetical protein